MKNSSFPKISVIVPVYNAEAYLYRCVDSLLAQTFQDFEILLIDDGSPDYSGEICDKYEQKDKRVRVFHKENGGVSSARQCGLDNARGEYTIHADPDDWVNPTMLEELYRKAKEEDADMVICDYFLEKKNKTIYVKQKPSSLDNEIVLCELFKHLYGSCWNKLVRRTCYEKFDIQFPFELFVREDLYVNSCLIAKNIRISYLGKAFYHYDQVVNSGSIVRFSRKRARMENEIILCDLLRKKIPDNMFQKIEFKLLFEMSCFHLALGVDLDRFRTDFGGLKCELKHLSVPLSKHVALWIALHISPYLVYWPYEIVRKSSAILFRVERIL